MYVNLTDEELSHLNILLDDKSSPRIARVCSHLLLCSLTNGGDFTHEKAMGGEHVELRLLKPAGCLHFKNGEPERG